MNGGGSSLASAICQFVLLKNCCCVTSPAGQPGIPAKASGLWLVSFIRNFYEELRIEVFRGLSSIAQTRMSKIYDIRSSLRSLSYLNACPDCDSVAMRWCVRPLWTRIEERRYVHYRHSKEAHPHRLRWMAIFRSTSRIEERRSSTSPLSCCIWCPLWFEIRFLDFGHLDTRTLSNEQSDKLDTKRSVVTVLKPISWLAK